MNDVNRDGAERLKPLDEFTLADLESMRLILRGDSVIDWRKLDFSSDERGPRVPRRPGAAPRRSRPTAQRMEHVKSEAIAYLRRQFDYPIPRPVERATVPELLILASGRGHRAMCACTILKCMHIIHHLDGRELLFLLPMSDQEVFHIVEEKVYRVIGGMLAGSFPIIEFVGGRKNKDSLITKLLSKQETIAAQIFDKLRFRVVTRTREDIFPVLQYLTQAPLPVQLRGPRAEHQLDLLVPLVRREDPAAAALLAKLQTARRRDDDFTPSDNAFSAEEYRIIHFVVDMPVRLPKRILDRAPAGRRAARERHLRHLRVPDRRPRHRDGQRARRGLARQVQGAAEEGRHAPPPARRGRANPRRRDPRRFGRAKKK